MPWALMDNKDLEAELHQLESIRSEYERDCTVRFGVLLADDDLHDHYLVKRALEKSSILGPIAQVCDGSEVINYLNGDGIYGDRDKFPFPSLLLLDVHMPHMDGFGVLKWLQSRRFSDLRVVALSVSQNPAIIEKVFSFGADHYQMKTAQPRKMELLVRRLELLMVLVHRHTPKADNMPTRMAA